MTESIDTSGYPLGFRFRDGPRPTLLGRGSGSATYVVEARMLAGHQKEAVVHEGEGGQAWRMTSDEGLQLRGTDRAPLPLGYFNAGVQGEILGRIKAMANERGISVADTALTLRNYYWFSGSFANGTGHGHADPSELVVSGLAAELRGLLDRAMRASPAVAALNATTAATFALYVNGRREQIDSLASSPAADAADPFLLHAVPPAPLSPAAPSPIRKADKVEDGDVVPFPDTVDGRLLRRVAGRAHLLRDGTVHTDTWLDLPGMSHFTLLSDERGEGNLAPSALAYLSAGIAFCYMTQLSRYMQAMKLDTGHLRMVQYCPFEVTEAGRGIAHPVDTHLFLNGRADSQTHEMLVRVAAATCYLHAALRTAIPPRVEFAEAPVGGKSQSDDSIV